MKPGSLRTVAVALGLAAVSAAVPACASRPKKDRDVRLAATLKEKFGFTGRRLAVDLGQSARTRLDPAQTQLEGAFLVLREEPNRVQTLDRDDLMPAWAYHALPGSLRYPPTLTAISMLLMSEDELHQVDLRFGHAMGPAIHFDLSPSAAFVGTVGTAFVPSWGGSRGEKTIRTLNLETGLEGWGYRTPGDIRGAMVIGGVPPRQTVYFATDAGDVYALPAAEADRHAPEPSWVQTARGPVTAGLTLEGDELFVAAESGFLYCLDRITGSVKWAAPHETPLTESPVATRVSVYEHRTGSLWCHDRATGNVRWRLAGASRLVAEREGKSVVAADNGDLWAVDGSGSVVGKVELAGRDFYYPTNSRDGSIFAVSADGYVFKLEVGGE
jgi:hypothetical protein